MTLNYADSPTYDDLVRAAGQFNDGLIESHNFKQFVRDWISLTTDEEVELLAGAITWAWQQMNEPTESEQ